TVDPLSHASDPSLHDAVLRRDLAGMTNSLILKGLSILSPSTQIAPAIVRVAFLFHPPTAPFAQDFLDPLKAAAPSLSVQVHASPVQNTSEMETVIAAFAREPGGGLIVLPSSFLAMHRDTIVALSERHRLPTIYSFKFYC